MLICAPATVDLSEPLGQAVFCHMAVGWEADACPMQLVREADRQGYNPDCLAAAGEEAEEVWRRLRALRQRYVPSPEKARLFLVVCVCALVAVRQSANGMQQGSYLRHHAALCNLRANLHRGSVQPSRVRGILKKSTTPLKGVE